MGILQFLKSLLSGMRGSGAKGVDQDPIGTARKDVNRLRLFAVNITDRNLQGLVYKICDDLTMSLAEAERKPGSIPILGPLLTVTSRMKESLELWLRVSQSGKADATSQKQMDDVVTMFRGLQPQYEELALKLVRENSKDLRVLVQVITGVLDPNGALPARVKIASP